MRVAALYDIHGNLPALEAVLQELNEVGIDQIVVGGDVVLGPMSKECIDTLLENRIPIHFIQGNCEVSILNQMKGNTLGRLPQDVLENIKWDADRLYQNYQKIISSWPKIITMEIEGLGKVLFCHATPRNETEIFTRLTPKEKLVPIFDNINAKIVVCGHTHMQFDITVGNVRVINAGSVGMPFGKPGANWLLLGRNIELHHTKYDVANAARKILKTRYPNAEDYTKNYVLQPPSEEKMLGILSKRELE